MAKLELVMGVAASLLLPIVPIALALRGCGFWLSLDLRAKADKLSSVAVEEATSNL